MTSPLNKKLARDLWRMKGQAFAITMVIALGVFVLILMDVLSNSLEETKRAYYERYRLASIFAPVKSMPHHVLTDLAKIPGVSAVQGRVVGRALIDIPQITAPLSAEVVSLPNLGLPMLNDVYMVSGRNLDPTQDDEILLLDGFAKVYTLKPGDKLTAIINGAKRTFKIVGLVQAPEFLYSAPPGEFLPDDSRFAVLWLNEKSLSSALDMKGAFNEALLSVSGSSNLPEIIRQVDLVLAHYGGLGAYALKDQVSNRFITDEINGLVVSRRFIPPIFLLIAAFLLNLVVARMIQTERSQIGLLKAMGYTSFEIGTHYFKFILMIAINGAILGCLMGIAFASPILSYYQLYYKFPFILYHFEFGAFITGSTVSILSASAGGIIVLRKIFGLQPAVAMHPPAPTDYSRLSKFSETMKRFLDQPSRMIIRRLIRYPIRAIGSVIGISSGMALTVSMMSVMGSFDKAIDLNFSIVDRSDVTVSFTDPLSAKSLYELRRLDGVLEVEPIVIALAIFRHGVETYRSAVTGLMESPKLRRAIDRDMQEIQLHKGGIILGEAMAKILHVKTGDILTIELLEGRRPTFDIPVAGITNSLFGSPAYMDHIELNKAQKQSNRISGAYLRIDTDKENIISHTIKNMPSVAGVTLKKEARSAFKKLLDTSAGILQYIMYIVAATITFGIVYNSASIGFAERARELASLRVLGFTETETAFILLGELTIITVAALLPGSMFGYFLTFAISAGFSMDLYQIPTMYIPEIFGKASLAVLAAAAISGWLVKRNLHNIDLLSLLKTSD
jgi:putative ABC transport system permease protein